MKALTSILIVEPSEIIYYGLRCILEETGSYNVLSPMSDATLLDEKLPSVRPDLLIVNPTLLSATPKQQLSSWMSLRPQMPVVALVYQYVDEALLGLFKYRLDIRRTRSEIASLLKSVVADYAENEEPAENTESYELSDRETDVLVLVAKGLSSKEIADKLNISVHTVNSHRKNITHKTGIKSVAGLAVYAMIHNLM